ncbi:MAG: nucleotide exchange factor GrpE, partial [Nitriliruptoraceae bacterium]
MTDQAHETPDPGTPTDGAAPSGADEQAQRWFHRHPPDAGPGADAVDRDDPAPLGVEPRPDTRTREELLDALHLAEQQRDEYLDDVRRARAEFENYRRRTTVHGAAQRIAGRADVAGGLLETLDDLQRTLDAAAASSD